MKKWTGLRDLRAALKQTCDITWLHLTQSKWGPVRHMNALHTFEILREYFVNISNQELPLKWYDRQKPWIFKIDYFLFGFDIRGKNWLFS